jgi:hypothetical protein
MLDNTVTPETITDSEREQAEKDAAIESKEADLKQHADKLIQGFAEIDNTSANRAVWELVQNACDLSANCKIVIDYSNDGFSFSHNGKPFKSVTLISLIKQVSNKDGVEVGKFGTGFITTHAFGRKFLITSLLDVKGRYINIENFEIDRSPMHWKDMVKNLREQEDRVYQLLKTGVNIAHEGEFKTTFTYLPETNTQKEYIKESSRNLLEYIPIVLTLSDVLHSVTVIDENGETIVYKKGEKVIRNSCYCTPIKKNDNTIEIYSLKDDNEGIEIILPLVNDNEVKDFSNSLAKLFLFYPLIGTEQWGCNFIIHSKNFYPTEPRDGIHLKSKTDQVQADEERNRTLIKRASEMIFEYVSTNAETLQNSIYLARASFKKAMGSLLLCEYFLNLQKEWVNHFKTCKLVKSVTGKLAPLNTSFLEIAILSKPEYYNNNYDIASLFWDNLPSKETAQEWTDVVIAWEDDILKLITVDDIAEQISLKGKLSFFSPGKLLQFYQFLIAIERYDIFENLDILPNIHGDFVSKSTLVKPLNIFPSLISISDVVVPTVSKKFIKTEFELGFDFSLYQRSDLSKDINDMLLSFQKDTAKNEVLPPNILTCLIQLCSIFSVENSISTRRKILPLICEYYKNDFEEEIQSNIDNDKFDFDYTPFRSLVRNFLGDFKKSSDSDINWIENNQNFLKDSLQILIEFADVKNIINELPIFPNQKSELCVHGELSKELNFLADETDNTLFKDIYERVVDKIREKLVHKEFTELLPNDNVKKAIELSGAIELELKNHPYDKISEHPYKDVVFNIIQKITGSREWESLFPDLNNRKAIIMMAKITDEDVKNDLFAIIGLDDKNKIAALGGLSQNPDMERIISLGQKALIKENEDNGDLEFKKKIGLHIEKLVRERLEEQVEEFSVVVESRQGGQDIIAKLGGEEIYYIEVKSRWEKNDSVYLSYLQSVKSVTEKDKYSLCSVDLSEYKVGQQDRYEPIIEDIYEQIHFINKIGYKIEKLIYPAIEADKNLEDVRLSDDYRVKVFQTFMREEGQLFDDFIDYLIDKLGLI